MVQNSCIWVGWRNTRLDNSCLQISVSLADQRSGPLPTLPNNEISSGKGDDLQPTWHVLCTQAISNNLNLRGSVHGLVPGPVLNLKKQHITCAPR